jgi:4-amino-4-deoxy-L-arabinose transferase-like glycosyltransferase
MDEPAHIACGVEWLTKGTYDLEAQHPPLSRIAAAIGPVLYGAKTQGYAPDLLTEGTAVLFDGGNLQPGDGKYERYVASARAGELPFFWLACAVIYLAAVRWMGRAQAALAVVIFTLIPPILAHSGLATTDIALTGTLALAFYAMARWIERPTIALGAFMGFSVGLAVISKFSSFAFLLACTGAAIVWVLVSKGGFATFRGWLTKPYLMSASISIPVLVLVVWGIFRFSWQGSTPAPELWEGIRQAQLHQTTGHTSYLFGERSSSGFLLFYPVSLAIKTPIGILALLLGGLVMAWKRRKQAAWVLPVAGFAGVMAVGFYSRINIGIRHVLPVYCFAVLIAAPFAWELLRSKDKWKGWVVGFLLLWAAASGVINHPDYLAYFNELAGSEPERIIADSDLDWGQDVTRLGKRLKELRADSFRFTTFTYSDLYYFGFPPVLKNDPYTPAPGWNAVSITMWKVFRLGGQGDRPIWPDQVKPTERVGKSILLYYFPPEAFKAGQP